MSDTRGGNWGYHPSIFSWKNLACLLYTSPSPQTVLDLVCRLLLESLFQNYCCHLVVFASLLYVVSTRTVVELLTELCALPVVDGLTGRRRTTVIARWHTVESWYDGLQCLVRRWRTTHHLAVVWLHPMKIANVWPRGDDQQHEEVDKADLSLEMHVAFTVVLSELPCCIHTRQYFEIRLRFDECYHQWFMWSGIWETVSY